MEITKDYLDELIQKKAEAQVEQQLRNVLLDWIRSDINGNGNCPIKFNDKCGELSGKNLYSTYGTGDTSLLNANCRRGNDECDTAMLEKYTNWNEVKSKLIEKYKKDETKNILNNLSGISDFLDENRWGYRDGE